MQSQDFKDKVAIVTGSYCGLGKEIAIELTRRGARVVICARHAERCEEVAEELSKNGGKAWGLRVDVTYEASVRKMVAQVVARWGTVDMLVNNAAIQGKIDWIVNYDAQEWDRIMAVNLKGPFLCAKAVLPGMIEKGRGKILNIAAGVMEERVDYGVAAYYASKAGLINFTRQLAAETKRFGLYVNAMDPCGMLTEITDQVIAAEEDHSEFKGVQTNRDPSKRCRRAEELVPLALFLLSSDSDMMTGRFLQASSQDDVQYLQL